LIRGDLPASLPFVPALVGVLVSYAALVGAAPAVGPAAFVDVCGLGGPACEAAAPLADEGPAEYATPAEINCPASEPTRGLVSHPEPPAPAAGDCSPPSLDFHYRVSRVPESERPSGALRPQRARRNSRPVAACTGLPLEHGSPLSIGSLQPIAMYAVLGLIPPSADSAGWETFTLGAARALEPLDRPPRT
jgi:hypothetical protein